MYQFGLAWWLIVDASVWTKENNANPIRFEYVLPGIFSSFALIMINVVDWSLIQGFAADESLASKAKCWVFTAFLAHVLCFIGAIVVLVEHFQEGSHYGGIAVVLQNILIPVS